ncbi:hypothetical protein WN12_03825|nr:hypothetical protein ABR30_0220720 [Enterobacter ludwigii]MXV01898.1 hypothetical protein [Enterobacter sp. ABFQC]
MTAALATGIADKDVPAIHLAHAIVLAAGGQKPCVRLISRWSTSRVYSPLIESKAQKKQTRFLPKGRIISFRW